MTGKVFLAIKIKFWSVPAGLGAVQKNFLLNRIVISLPTVIHENPSFATPWDFGSALGIPTVRDRKTEENYFLMKALNRGCE